MLVVEKGPLSAPRRSISGRCAKKSMSQVCLNAIVQVRTLGNTTYHRNLVIIGQEGTHKTIARSCLLRLTLRGLHSRSTPLATLGLFDP